MLRAGYRKTLFTTTLSGLIFLALTPVAIAQSDRSIHDSNPFCRSESTFSEHLATYNQVRIWTGSSGTNKYEIYSSKDSLAKNKVTADDATWTVDYVPLDGSRCLVATGIHWRGNLHERVLGVPWTGRAKDVTGQHNKNLKSRSVRGFAIGKTRLHSEGPCKNGYSLDKVLTLNPFVIGKGIIEEASDHVNEYSMSAHHPDYLFLLSSSPTSQVSSNATWAILYALSVTSSDFKPIGCTYIEAVGTHGQRKRPPEPRQHKKAPTKALRNG